MTEPSSAGLGLSKRWFWLPAMAWTFILAVSLSWSIVKESEESVRFGTFEARAMLDQMSLIRAWNVEHEGIYAEVDKDNPPNPYLEGLVAERDITTPLGTKLTLVNHAYLTRQLAKLHSNRDTHSVRLVSLKPLRPEDAPDAWERSALQAFEQGILERKEVTEIDGEPFVRLMQPLIVEDSCLQCHAQQGYKLGDIRGGIVASVELTPHKKFIQPHINNLIFFHGLLWLLGVGAVRWGSGQLQARMREQEAFSNSLQESEERYRAQFEDSHEAMLLLAPPTWKFTSANAAALRMFGISDEQSFLDLCPWDISSERQPDGSLSVEKAREIIDKAMLEGALFFEWQLQRMDGSTFFAEVLLTRMGKGEKSYLQASVRDITERKELEEELQQRVTEADDARRSMLFMLEDINETNALVAEGKREWEGTFDAVTEPIFLHDREFRIVRANRAYAEIAGTSVQKLIGKPYWQVFPQGDGPLPGCVKAMGKAEKSVEEICTDDGRFYLSHSYPLKGKSGEPDKSIHFLQNITEQRLMDINLEHANRALTALSTVNRELVHAKKENDLLQAICQAVVEQHGYHMAWVGYVQEDKKKSIEIVASAGFEQSLLKSIKPSWAKNATGMGPSGRAVLSGKVQLSQSIAQDSEYPPWQKKLLESGCGSGLALPLKDDEKKVFGLLHVYAQEANAFAEREIALLQETADDLAFGVHALRVRLQRDEVLEINQQQLVQLRESLKGTIEAVARAEEARDPYTAGHQRRVAALAEMIARQMGLDEEHVLGIYLGAAIHDIGKIRLPSEILTKPTRLRPVEYELIKTHPQVGHDILMGIDFPWPIADIALQHHERLDGGGYPQGLRGNQICMEAKIVAVADVVEAMASDRPYRAGLGVEKAIEEIRNSSGVLFEPEVVEACVKVLSSKEFDIHTLGDKAVENDD